MDLKPLAPPPSPPPQQKVPLLPPPAFDDHVDDAMDGGGGGGGGGNFRDHHRRVVPIPTPPPPFQRQSVGRCSVQQPMVGHHYHHRVGANYSGGGVSEYFIPRSASAHDLCSTIEMQKIPPPLPPSALRTTAATLARPPRPQTTRDKMVTFEDEKLAYDQHRHQEQQPIYRSSGDLIV